MSHLLIIDDDQTVAKGLRVVLKGESYKLSIALDRKTAETILRQEEVELVICDLMVPTKEDGLSLVRFAKAQNPLTQVMVVTGFGSIENAVEAMKAGADDFVVKGFDAAELKLKLGKLMQAHHRETEQLRCKLTVRLLQDELAQRGHYHQLIGESRVIKDLLRKIEQIAQSNFRCCLVEGETGSGKELAARMIHRLSPRRDKPFIAINCAALPEHLVESELFGHERGAFTGADRTQLGKFELGQGGIIVLDEVAELNPSVQTKLLRILEESEFYRVGGQKPVSLDVAIIASTNRDLRRAVQMGKFREEIFYRLNVVKLTMPPLRGHLDDIPLLVEHFLRQFNQTKGMAKTTSTKALDILQGYDYPGNVRELQNILDNAMTFARSDVITPDDLMPKLDDSFKARIHESDVEHIKQVLQKHKGNITHAAEELGYTREGLTRKLKKLGLRSNKEVAYRLPLRF